MGMAFTLYTFAADYQMLYIAFSFCWLTIFHKAYPDQDTSTPDANQ